MKTVAGIILIVVGVVFGIWAGFVWAFVGGIIDVITVIRAPEMVAMDVAIGIAKIMFAGVIGGFAGLVLVIPGVAMLK